MNSSTGDPLSLVNAAQKVRKFWTKKDEADIEVLRCNPLHYEEYESRLATTSRQVVTLLTNAYTSPAGAASNNTSANGATRIAPVSEAHKAYASKVMSTLRSFPELGPTRDAVISRYRSVAGGAAS